MQNYLAVDLQHRLLRADQRVQSRRATARLPVKHRDCAEHPNILELWSGIRMCLGKLVMHKEHLGGHSSSRQYCGGDHITGDQIKCAARLMTGPRCNTYTHNILLRRLCQSAWQCFFQVQISGRLATCVLTVIARFEETTCGGKAMQQ